MNDDTVELPSFTALRPTLDPTIRPYNGSSLERSGQVAANLKRPEVSMPKYIVERVVPEVGDLTLDKLNHLASLARTALESFGGRVQWIESFVTQHKIYSVITAPDEATVRQYCKLTNLPTDHIYLVKLVADITTGE
jgi:hypothetical protein